MFLLPTDDEEISVSTEAESAEIQDSPMNSLVASSHEEPLQGATETSRCYKSEKPRESSTLATAENRSLELAKPVEEVAGTTEAGEDHSTVYMGPDRAGELLGPGQEDTEPTLSVEELAMGLDLGGEAHPPGLLQDGEAIDSTGDPMAQTKTEGQKEEKGQMEEEVGGDISALRQLEDRLQHPASMKRKNRPCCLPVSKLETVITSACSDPETPRTHYIHIHTLLHSMPLTQDDIPQEDEGTKEESTLKNTLERDGLSEGDRVAAELPALEEGFENHEGATIGTMHLGLSGLANSSVPSTGSESDSSPRQGGDHSFEGCDTSSCSPSCYSSSCYSTSCYSSSCYSGSCYNDSRFTSHTRFSSLDSAKISESTVFSSQDEEEENSAFESVSDSVQSPELDPESVNVIGPWQEETTTSARSVARTLDGLESPVAGPSNQREG